MFNLIGISTDQQTQCRADTPVRLVLLLPLTLPTLRLRRRNPNSIRRYQVHIPHFRPQFYLLQSCLLRRLGKELQEILMLEPARKVLQIRGKSYGRPVEPDVISFASGLVRQLREVKLAPISLPVAMTEVANAWRVNRRHNNSGALRILDCLVQVGVKQVARAVIAVDSIRGHEYLPASGALRPAFDQISQRKIRAAIGSSDSHRQAQSLRRLRMIGGQILF